MGRKQLSPVDRHVCTACGREGCHLLVLPAPGAGADALVHQGERICKRCLDERERSARASGLFVRCRLPEPAPVQRACCGGCQAQAVGSSEC